MKNESKNMAKNAKKNSPTSRNQRGVMLEDVNSKLDLVLEQFSGLNRKIDGNHQDFLEFKDEMIGFREQTENNFKELFKFKDETNENFSVVKEYLIRIDEEIQDMRMELQKLRATLKEKANLDRLAGFEKRLLKVEKLVLAKMNS